MYVCVSLLSCFSSESPILISFLYVFHQIANILANILSYTVCGLKLGLHVSRKMTDGQFLLLCTPVYLMCAHVHFSCLNIVTTCVIEFDVLQ